MNVRVPVFAPDIHIHKVPAVPPPRALAHPLTPSYCVCPSWRQQRSEGHGAYTSQLRGYLICSRCERPPLPPGTVVPFDWEPGR